MQEESGTRKERVLFALYRGGLVLSRIDFWTTHLRLESNTEQDTITGRVILRIEIIVFPWTLGVSEEMPRICVGKVRGQT